MNSTPPAETAASAAEQSGPPARSRVTDYDLLVDDIAYSYEGILSRDSVAQAVADAREALEPTATIPDFLPILVSLTSPIPMTSPSTGCATSETTFKPALPLDYVTSTSDTKEPLMADKPSVLFVCVHNAGRSQMAAGYLNHFAGDRIEVRSAGSEPADKINPVAVQAMAEEGIDIAAQHPKILTTEAVKASDVVITMGCGDTCPFYPGKRYEDWVLDDPAGQDINDVRPIRDEIKGRVEQLISELQPISSPACGV